MTHLALFQTLTHIAEEFDRLRLGVADRLETHEEAAFLGLIFALEAIVAGSQAQTFRYALGERVSWKGAPDVTGTVVWRLCRESRHHPQRYVHYGLTADRWPHGVLIAHELDLLTLVTAPAVEESNLCP